MGKNVNMNIKGKTFAMFLLFTFILGIIPSAFAQEGSNASETIRNALIQGTKNIDKNILSKDRGNKTAAQTNLSEMLRQKLDKGNQGLNERLKDLRGKNNETIQKLITDRKEFLQIDKSSKEERQQVLKEAKDAKKSGNINESIDKFKDFLIKTADQWITELNEIKSKVQEGKELSEQQKSDILSSIDSQVSSLNSAKGQIQATTTKDELKAAAKSLKESRADSFRRIFSLRILAARIEGHVNRAKILESRLDAIAQRAKKKNIDISSDVISFKNKIQATSDKNKQAQDKLSQVIAFMKNPSSDKERIKSLMDDARNLLKDSEQELKQAHEILKSIVSKIKSSATDSSILET